MRLLRAPSPPATHGCAELESLDLMHNAFTRLPPALACATALTRLVLSMNEDLQVMAADVDAVLLRMPHLARLSADLTATPTAVLDCLLVARPQLLLC